MCVCVYANASCDTNTVWVGSHFKMVVFRERRSHGGTCTAHCNIDGRHTVAGVMAKQSIRVDRSTPIHFPAFTIHVFKSGSTWPGSLWANVLQDLYVPGESDQLPNRHRGRWGIYNRRLWTFWSMRGSSTLCVSQHVIYRTFSEKSRRP